MWVNVTMEKCISVCTCHSYFRIISSYEGIYSLGKFTGNITGKYFIYSFI